MGIQSKTLTGLSVVILACGIQAGEIFRAQSSADFQKSENLTESQGIFTLKGRNVEVFSVKELILDPAKKYRISGEFRLKTTGLVARAFFGYAPYDAKGVLIRPMQVFCTPGSDTVLLEDAFPGAKTLKVKDASKWANDSNYIAFDTKPDFSDLPNRRLVRAAKGGAVNRHGVWEIALTRPLDACYPAGTGIRQQQDDGCYIYNGGWKFLDSNWTMLSGELTGKEKNTISNSKLWPGTARVRIVILTDVRTDSRAAIEFKNITVEEVK